MKTSNQIIFFQVNDPSLKLKRIVETATGHFRKKELIVFFVENEKAQVFLDELLWKFPNTSFLPHIATDTATTEPIAITKSKSNINQAKIAFNLCPTPLIIQEFKIIYDFEDLTTLNKQNLSSIRFNAYKEAGYMLSSVH